MQLNLPTPFCPASTKRTPNASLNSTYKWQKQHPSSMVQLCSAGSDHVPSTMKSFGERGSDFCSSLLSGNSLSSTSLPLPFFVMVVFLLLQKPGKGSIFHCTVKVSQPATETLMKRKKMPRCRHECTTSGQHNSFRCCKTEFQMQFQMQTNAPPFYGVGLGGRLIPLPAEPGWKRG